MVNFEKGLKNGEFLALQASQRFKMAKKLQSLLSSAFPVEVQGCLIHRKGTRKK